MPRRFVVALLAFLLLGMQQEAQWHALAHFGEWLQCAHDQALKPPPDDGPCAICAFFAGGATAAPNDRSSPSVQPQADEVAFAGVPVVAIARPSFYLSRAPPAFL